MFGLRSNSVTELLNSAVKFDGVTKCDHDSRVLLSKLARALDVLHGLARRGVVGRLDYIDKLIGDLDSKSM